MKICFITTGDIKNIATAKRALGLANPLSELGYEVSIVMEDAAENRHRVAMECSDRVKLYYFPRGGAIAEIRHKNRYIREIDPDYLYICGFVPRNIVGIRDRARRLVEHSELLSAIPNIGITRWLTSYLCEYYSVIYSDGIINASLHLQKLYLNRAKRFLRNIPMLYLPYAYNPEVVKRIEIDYDEPKFSNLQGLKLFLFLGSVTKNYGVFTILEATNALRDRCSNFKVLILGHGANYEDAIQYVRAHNLEEYVSLPGYVDEEDIASYFSLATAFISPMHDTIQDWARCPSKLYMYLPYGKPIITCKIGEPYEILKRDGYFYTPNNAQEMAAQMERVIANDDTPIGIAPLDHTWESRAMEFDNWIKNIN